MNSLLVDAEFEFKELLAEALFNSPWVPVGYNLVGSSYIKDEITNDVDFIVLVKKLGGFEHCHDEIWELEPKGWQFGGSISTTNTSNWASFKRTVNNVLFNMIIITEPQYYNDWKKAAEVCKLLEQHALVKLTKNQRCAVHAVIMDNLLAHDANIAYNVIPIEEYLEVPFETKMIVEDI